MPRGAPRPRHRPATANAWCRSSAASDWRAMTSTARRCGPKKLGPFRDEFGSASSPILVDGKISSVRRPRSRQLLDGRRRRERRNAVADPARRLHAQLCHAGRVGGRRPQADRRGRRAGSWWATTWPAASQLWSLDGFARIVNTTPAVVDDTLYVCTWSPGGDTDARIAMEPWSTALDLWDKNKNSKLENEELPGWRSPLAVLSHRLEQRPGARRSRVEQVCPAVRAGPEHAGRPAARRSGPAAADGVGIQARLALRGQPAGLSRAGVFMVKDGGVVTLLDAANGKLIKQARARGARQLLRFAVAGDGKIYTASGAGVGDRLCGHASIGSPGVARLRRAHRRHARSCRRPHLLSHRKRPCIASGCASCLSTPCGNSAANLPAGLIV